jgi:hypothetical protein
MSKAKYLMINGDTVIAIVYEDERYGRTMVVQEKINPNFDIKVCDVGITTGNSVVQDVDLIDYLQSLLPIK